ncbi:MAG TPA: methyltransferase domain-containing protein [Acidimicrobiales bacterium]|nr:methyltransferase domain-containing protein [Acidimicrobiales bacterium]
MDRATVDAYDRRGATWAARRTPVRAGDARAFARSLAPGTRRLDLGCGAGRYLGELGTPAVGIDASLTMLGLCREAVPGVPVVLGDLENLPFGRHTFGAAWANMSYLHVARDRLPAALAQLHAVLVPGAPLDLQVLAGDYEGDALPQDDVGGRFFAAWRPETLGDVVVGAGFELESVGVHDEVVRVRARRGRTLPDTVGPGMRLLLVGLNPSVYSADAGVGFARAGNRFWGAAVAAGMTARPRDPWHLLRVHGVGMTDVVKRATPRAAELTPDEYRAGMGRVERLVTWLEPGAVCFVGLGAWRAARDRGARAGIQPEGLGGRPVYVMPSTSGLNAHATPAVLAEHVRAALALAASV